MTDPITDMLNRIRNAQAVFKSRVFIPFSKIKYDIAKILEKEGFIEKAEKKGRGVKRSIEIVLKYEKDEFSNRPLPAISGLKRISKPGQRIYVGWRDIKRARGGYGISIISTSKGLLSDKEAKKRRLGGEVICEIW